MTDNDAKLILNSLCAGISNLETLEAITMAIKAFDEIKCQKAEIERLERLNGDLVKIADTRKKTNFSLLSEKILLARELKTAKAEGIIEGMQKAMNLIADELKRNGG